MYRRRMHALVILTLMVCLILPFSGASDSALRDDAAAFGDWLGKNEVRETSAPRAYVIGKKLFMHATSDLSSSDVHVLGESEFVEVLDAQNGALLVYDTEGDEKGNVITIEGWIDEQFAVVSNRWYVAMHPTPVYIDASRDAKIIRMMDTYDSLVIAEEHDGFYSVLIHGAIGYVEKE